MLRDVTERKVLQHAVVPRRRWSRSAASPAASRTTSTTCSRYAGQVELLQDDLEVLESARARIDSVQRATDRAAALTDDLMAFSRQRIDRAGRSTSTSSSSACESSSTRCSATA